ncbi:hypothetical protein QCA50_011577 [Cerrena zonata]|uniref:O-methyltransferase C-terminal domain-containing protein n=1 Tax=Cerrena zonata TaxID=2478898 RepID=A0AAW0G0I3_9APHY
MSHFTAACFNVVSSTKVAEHLQGKPNGLHISQLASLTSVDENKLDRALRLLASKHCFREVTPNTFANNRLSVSLLSDIGAFVNYLTHETYYAGSALAGTLIDPKLTSSIVASEAAFGRAMKYNGTMWDWYRDVSPEKSKRFDRGMAGYGSMLHYDTVANGFPWKDQPEGTIICDVGGGRGHVSMYIAKTFPQNRFSVVVQDLPPTIEQAKAFWNDTAPDLVKNRRVDFVSFDFLKDDAAPGCDIYYIKSVLHDWPDSDCKIIMAHIRNAMKPTSRLLIDDILIQHAVHDPDDKQFIEKAPEPLLANYGEGKVLHYYVDVCMMVLCFHRDMFYKAK